MKWHNLILNLTRSNFNLIKTRTSLFLIMIQMIPGQHVLHFMCSYACILNFWYKSLTSQETMKAWTFCTGSTKPLINRQNQSYHVLDEGGIGLDNQHIIHFSCLFIDGSTLTAMDTNKMHFWLDKFTSQDYLNQRAIETTAETRKFALAPRSHKWSNKCKS